VLKKEGVYYEWISLKDLKDAVYLNEEYMLKDDDGVQNAPVSVSYFAKSGEFPDYKDNILVFSFSDTRGKRRYIPIAFKETDQYEDADAAMNPPGGIDLNRKNMQMNVSKPPSTGPGQEAMNFKFDPAMIERMKKDGFDGFVPVILNITPLESILPILGLQSSRKEGTLAKI
jgi:hypothetical protein